jgi:hypothetical protein
MEERLKERTLEAAQMPMREAMMRMVECLKPADTLLEHPSLPVVRPRMKEWRTRGVMSTFLRVIWGIPNPPREVRLAKNLRKMTVVDVSRIAPI